MTLGNHPGNHREPLRGAPGGSPSKGGTRGTAGRPPNRDTPSGTNRGTTHGGRRSPPRFMMNRTTTLAAVISTILGTILGATAVLTVQAVRRQLAGKSPPDFPHADSSIPPQRVEDVPATMPVTVVPPAGNGDSATPNLDRILGERAAEQRDDLA